jgi:hypothetical protein
MTDFKGIESLAALPVAVVMGYFMYLISSRVTNEVIRLATNHMEHNTEALNELRKAVSELTLWIKITTKPSDGRDKGPRDPFC